MTTSKEEWEKFTHKEISEITPILIERELKLEREQPHISGERFLMSGPKVVLVARDGLNQRVIIKSSADPEGINEIFTEQEARQTLEKIPFAYHLLHIPRELWQQFRDGRLTVATEFIEQPNPYLSLPLTEQLDLILNAFKMLEGVHATTATHTKTIKRTFGVWQAKDYIKNAQQFIASISNCSSNEAIINTLREAFDELTKQNTDIERYCNFLTHDDFALHNFRFQDDAIYLIDQSSLRFGNKHESWARFLNYMLLYNRDLEQALLKYLKDNAAPEELRSLRLMRIYKVIELLNYHCRASTRSEGNTKKLSERRVTFWHEVLQSLCDNQPTHDNVIQDYQRDRDQLRSAEEVSRQKALQQLV